MTQDFQDFRLQPAARVLWRRAADELLIDAIFGDAIFGPLPNPDAGGDTMPQPASARPLSLEWTGVTPSSLAIDR